MTLLVDAQLSPSIAKWINENFSDINAISVWNSGLRAASDRHIYDFAKENGFVILSKDADFLDLIDRLGSPPKVIWVTCGNTSNASMREIFSKTLQTSCDILQSGENMVEISDLI